MARELREDRFGVCGEVHKLAVDHFSKWMEDNGAGLVMFNPYRCARARGSAVGPTHIASENVFRSLKGGCPYVQPPFVG
jgi:hypothetical protein